MELAGSFGAAVPQQRLGRDVGTPDALGIKTPTLHGIYPEPEHWTIPGQALTGSLRQGHWILV